MESNLVLGYWQIRGKGQVSRFLLEYCGATFTDKKYTSFEDWFGKDKQQLGFDFPNLPYLIDGDFKLTESSAIERYIIGKFDKTQELIGTEALECSTQTMLISFIDDISTQFIKLVFNLDGFDSSKEEIYQKEFKPRLEKLAKYLGSKKFLTGDEVKYADFVGYENVVRLNMLYQAFASEFPTLVQWLQNFENVPKIQDYMSSDRFSRVPITPPGLTAWTGL